MHLSFKIAENVDDKDICFKLRESVFIQEQNVPVDMERDEDDERATHFILFNDCTPIGVGRIVDNKSTAIVGRVGILSEFRGKGAGLFLMMEIIGYCKQQGFQKIILGAQEHALGFYEKLGFKICSDKYMDANIPHFKMQLEIFS